MLDDIRYIQRYIKKRKTRMFKLNANTRLNRKLREVNTRVTQASYPHFAQKHMFYLHSSYCTFMNSLYNTKHFRLPQGDKIYTLHMLYQRRIVHYMSQIARIEVFNDTLWKYRQCSYNLHSSAKILFVKHVHSWVKTYKK